MIMETERLLIRPWEEQDLDPFVEMNADPRVMEFFPSTMGRVETKNMLERVHLKVAQDGFCFSPIILKETGAFLGFVGLSRPGYPKPLPFDPCVEIGWRLSHAAWGHGYASEAARAWIGFGFETLELPEIVSFTTRKNSRSQAVMKRLGMTRQASDDFMHPMLDENHPQAPHVLYRLDKADWEKASGL